MLNVAWLSGKHRGERRQGLIRGRAEFSYVPAFEERQKVCPRYSFSPLAQYSVPGSTRSVRVLSEPEDAADSIQTRRAMALRPAGGEVAS